MFITIEGTEGGGKTTQATLLSKWLNENAVEHLLTKEPGTVISKECQQIRELILSPQNDISPRAEFFLYLADRAQHVEKHIMPTLRAGKWVVSDRYLDSTKVYQGYGRGLNMKEITPMIDYASHGVMPDLTFILDIDVSVGLSRAKSSNTEFEGGDRMERERLSFHETLREGFLEIANTHDRYMILDASKSIDELHQEIVGIVGRLI